MCPSYQVTGEDKHSTRGRARLLFEMAAGSVITGGWRAPEVAEAMDLCLSCKGCKRDCPVGVDMAAYKTEYLAQRYHRRLRPRAHYAMGALPRWLRIASAVPGLAAAANSAARIPALAVVAKKIGGIAPERDIPPLARRTFRREFLGRVRRGNKPAHSPSRGVIEGSEPAHSPLRGVIEGSEPAHSPLRGVVEGSEPAHSPSGPASGATSDGAAGGRRILLWPDTFTDHFDPDIGHAAVTVLEALGYRVEVPEKPVCCGLTWYSTGQIGAARRVLRRSLDVLRPWLDEGVPVVGLEPSCLAALRADAGELLPGDPAATALSGSIRTFAEILVEHGDELATLVADGPALRALVQVHCHQHADLGSEADATALAALGVEAHVLDSGCCGLAGNWGFEQGHYEVSMACAERVLLPAVRAAEEDVAVLADGFSCRTQLRQAGECEPVHLAQIAARALGL
jgi:Fe-S oxidoreductase